MSRRHPFENRYCGHCLMTTRHEVRCDGSFGCLRCGSVKLPPRVSLVRVVRGLPVLRPLPRGGV